MQRVALVVAVGLLFVGHGLAQVTAELLLDQDQFIPGEPIQVAVRVVNRSGETLKLGAQPDWLSFTVDGKDGAVVEGSGQVPVSGEFVLESAQMVTKSVQLTPYFRFNKQGRYELAAVVRIPGWTQTVVSKPKRLQVTKGAEIKKVEFGVPGSGGQTGVPEVRKYTLVKSTQQRKGITFFVQVSDASESVLLRVTAIGPAVSFSEPEIQLDRFSNLHVLWQNGARTYIHAAVNPEGQLFVRQAYDFEQRRPVLAANAESGRIGVVNGIRRKTAQDIPPE